jgi:high-affinity nickel-transport protein
MFRGEYKPQSRFQMFACAGRWLHWKLNAHRHPHLAAPQSGDWNYDSKSAFIVGIIHGLGAETPTQLLIFLLAANLGGIGKGFLGLGMFLLGLLVMNTLMTASAAGLFGVSMRMPKVQMAVTAVTAVYSLAVGGIFLFGSAGLLPALGS